uniref:Rho-GAP domain-containing protein n=1 Tax=Macrostomum lignano TaxID=282301 RepID=A0A1I8FE98_9PLAT
DKPAGAGCWKAFSASRGGTGARALGLQCAARRAVAPRADDAGLLSPDDEDNDDCIDDGEALAGEASASRSLRGAGRSRDDSETHWNGELSQLRSASCGRLSHWHARGSGRVARLPAAAGALSVRVHAVPAGLQLALTCLVHTGQGSGTRTPAAASPAESLARRLMESAGAPRPPPGTAVCGQQDSSYRLTGQLLTDLPATLLVPPAEASTILIQHLATERKSLGSASGCGRVRPFAQLFPGNFNPCDSISL